MNKMELVAEIAKKTGLTKINAERATEAVLKTIATSLKKGDEVRLVGFGTFSVTKREATTGRNPRTGAEIKIPASKQPKFKAGKVLKDSLN